MQHDEIYIDTVQWDKEKHISHILRLFLNLPKSYSVILTVYDMRLLLSVNNVKGEFLKKCPLYNLTKRSTICLQA